MGKDKIQCVNDLATLFSFDLRYRAIVYPLKTLSGKKIARTAAMVTVIWLLAGAISLPYGIYTISVSYVVPTKSDDGIAYKKVTHLGSSMTKIEAKSYVMGYTICQFIVPISIMIFCYSHVVWKLWHPETQLTQENVISSSQRKAMNVVRKRKRKTTIMLMTVVLVSFLVTLPFHVFGSLLAYRDID